MAAAEGPAPAAGAPVVSVVVPMYNEETNVAAFVDAVVPVLEAEGTPFELILVDDGSRDGTWARIEAAATRSPGVRGLSLSRNFGHQGALFAGLSRARGQAIISMDGDLQHPPSALPELLAAWRSGYQVVDTQRGDSADTSWFKRATSRWFYAIFTRLTGVPMSAGSSDFRLLDRRALDELLEMRDPDSFIRGLVSWLGFRRTVLPYQAAARFSGVSKFNLRRMLRFAVGAMISFSLLPLRLGIWIGFLTSAAAFAELVYILVRFFQGATIPGWASLMTVMSFMFGVLFVLLGIIGTYLGKIYEVLKARPRFVVGRECGAPSLAPRAAGD